MTRALLIMGPTASGKSALALALAEAACGEIINADSMQVYRDWRILSARPTKDEEARAPHWLYGHVDAAEVYSAGRWVEEAYAAIAAIRARGNRPIVVGGTGLYFKALTEGLAPAPATDQDVRARLKAELDRAGAEAMHARLEVLDPDAAAHIEPADTPRLLRALEVAERGEKLSELQKEAKPLLRDWRGVTLWPDRAVLYDRINARFDAMIEAGSLSEVLAMGARALPGDRPAMKAHGAPGLMAHLKGQLSLEEAVEQAKRDTRHYAKRQYTWINGQMANWPRCEAGSVDERMKFALKVAQ